MSTPLPTGRRTVVMPASLVAVEDVPVPGQYPRPQPLVAARYRLQEHLVQCDELGAQLVVDAHADAFELGGGEVVVEVEAGADQDPAGADHHGEQIDHLLHLGLLLEVPPDAAYQADVGLLADEQPHVGLQQGERDRDEEHTDAERRGTVPEDLTGELVQADAGERQYQSDERGGVLQYHRFDGGILGIPQIAADRDHLAPGLAAQLAEALGGRDRLQDEGDREHDVVDPRRGAFLLAGEDGG